MTYARCYRLLFVFFFFFQAEDGIRDKLVTGVQTCALPISGTNDNCGVASVSNDAPATFPVGITTVHWTATDVHGNTNGCQQTVTVIDNQPPTISCPANITTNASPGQCSITGLNLGVPATNDNCGVASVTSNAPAQFAVGTNVVIWTVVDVHGNSNSCTQTIIVRDLQPPSITCPANITTNTPPGQCAITGLNLAPPTTNDNCGATITSNDAPTPL